MVSTRSLSIRAGNNQVGIQGSNHVSHDVSGRVTSSSLENGSSDGGIFRRGNGNSIGHSSTQIANSNLTSSGVGEQHRLSDDIGQIESGDTSPVVVRSSTVDLTSPQSSAQVFDLLKSMTSAMKTIAAGGGGFKSNHQADSASSNVPKSKVPTVALPSSFSGRNEVSVSEWLQQFIIRCNASSYDDTTRSKLLPTVLSEQALAWWQQQPMLDQENWKLISNRLEQAFTPPNATSINKAKLLQRKQKNDESVDDYSCDLLRIYKSLGNNNNKVDLVEIFIDNMAPVLQVEVRKSLPEESERTSELTFQEVLKKAKHIESNYYRAWNCNVTSNNKIINMNGLSNAVATTTHHYNVSQVQSNQNSSYSTMHPDRRVQIEAQSFATQGSTEIITALSQSVNDLKRKYDQLEALSGNFSNKKSRINNNNKKKTKCENCHFTGHDRNTCYRLFGYPKDWKRPIPIGCFRQGDDHQNDGSQIDSKAIRNRNNVQLASSSTAAIRSVSLTSRPVENTDLKEKHLIKNSSNSLTTQATIDGVQILVVTDTGAEVSCIDEKLFKQLPAERQRQFCEPSSRISVSAAGQSPLNVIGSVKIHLVMKPLHHGDEMTVLVIRDLGCDMLLGMDALQSVAENIDLIARSLTLSDGRGEIYFRNPPNDSIEVESTESGFAKFSIRSVSNVEMTKFNKFDLIKQDQQSASESLIWAIDNLINQNANMNLQQKQQMIDLLKEWSILLGKPKAGATTHNNINHQIRLVENSKIINLHPYRCSPATQMQIDKHVAELLQNEMIEESNSSWSSPVLLVSKKDGSTRMVIDYRNLNSITRTDSYSVPRIDETLDAVGTPQFISTFDLAQGFHQIPLAIDAREKTAFKTRRGHYQYKVMPFGLCNAPATFQRFMDSVFKGMHGINVQVYLDDIIVFSNSFEQHLIDIRQVFERLNSATLRIKISKCRLAQHEVEFLGHIVGREGRKPNESKIDAIKHYKKPVDKKEVQSFLGICGYYRDYINHFATISKPLIMLTKSGNAFVWNDESDKAFETLKKALSTSPVLAQPDFTKEFIIQTDASNVGLGAVLAQKDSSTNKERVVQYASRTLNKAEESYSTTEKEALALVWAVTKFRCYVEGVAFSVITDHNPLQYLKTVKADKYGRLGRWSMILQSFIPFMKIVYKKGSSNSNADALSRAPMQCSVDDIETLRVRAIQTLAYLKETNQQSSKLTSKVLKSLTKSQGASINVRLATTRSRKKVIDDSTKQLKDSRTKIDSTHQNENRSLNAGDRYQQHIQDHLDAADAEFVEDMINEIQESEQAEVDSLIDSDYYNPSKQSTRRSSSRKKKQKNQIDLTESTNASKDASAAATKRDQNEQANSVIRLDQEVSMSINNDEIDNLQQQWNITSIIEAQHESGEFKAVIDHLKGGDAPMITTTSDGTALDSLQLKRYADEFVLSSNGALYHYWWPNSHRKRSEMRRQLVIPTAELQQQVIEQCHDVKHAGHLGITKTLQRVKDRFYWSTMNRDIENYVRSCLECTNRKSAAKGLAKRIPIQSMPIYEPWWNVVTDVIGPLSESRRGNKYIIVFTDSFSRYQEAVAIPNQEAETIAKIFIEIVCLRHGCPKILQSDQGTNFVSELAKNVYDLMNTHKSTATGYRPQTQGITERFNQTLVNMISCYLQSTETSDEYKNWDLLLPYMLFAYNTSYNSTTNEIPFYVIHGRIPRQPIDHLLEYDGNIFESTNDYCSEVVRRQTIARHLIRELLGEVQLKYKQNNSSIESPLVYQPNDWIRLYQPKIIDGISKKLLSQWLGPFKVIRQIGPVNYKIQRTADAKHKSDWEQTVHVARMKPFVINDSKYPRRKEWESTLSGDANQLTHSIDDFEQEVEVDSIQDHKMIDGHEHFLVHFKDDTNAWLPSEDLTNCQETVDEYRRTIVENRKSHYSNRPTSSDYQSTNENIEL